MNCVVMCAIWEKQCLLTREVKLGRFSCGDYTLQLSLGEGSQNVYASRFA